MIPGINPKQMQKMMKQMGVEQEDLPVHRVDLYFDDHKIVVEPAQVAIVKMMGQETFQVTGDLHREEFDNSPTIPDEDVQTVAEQAGVSQEKAKEALEASDGDLAEAILQLQG